MERGQQPGEDLSGGLCAGVGAANETQSLENDTPELSGLPPALSCRVTVDSAVRLPYRLS